MNNMAKLISICMIIISIIMLAIFPLVFNLAFGSQITTHIKNQNRLPLPPLTTNPTIIGQCMLDQFDQTRWAYIHLAKEVECMAENIYFEARGQDIKGQIAVGLVTINRVVSSRYPNSVCDVVWQKRENKKGKLVAQFSWTLDEYSNTPKKGKAWTLSHQIAESLLAEGTLFNIVDFTHKSTHYHANYVLPFWSKDLNQTIIIGDHLFYNTSTVAQLP